MLKATNTAESRKRKPNGALGHGQQGRWRGKKGRRLRQRQDDRAPAAHTGGAWAVRRPRLGRPPAARRRPTKLPDPQAPTGTTLITEGFFHLQESNHVIFGNHSGTER